MRRGLQWSDFSSDCRRANSIRIQAPEFQCESIRWPPKERGLKISLVSGIDTYLYLTRNGHVIAKDDNDGDGTKASLNLENSQISSQAYSKAYYAAIDPENTRTTFSDWKTANGFSTADYHVTFRDEVDLGYGRDMYARTSSDGSIAIYVENYVVQISSGDV